MGICYIAENAFTWTCLYPHNILIDAGQCSAVPPRGGVSYGLWDKIVRHTLRETRRPIMHVPYSGLYTLTPSNLSTAQLCPTTEIGPPLYSGSTFDLSSALYFLLSATSLSQVPF